MRWLLIALLVSVGVLLLAAAGIVRHVLLYRRKLKRTASASGAPVVSAPEESDLESES
jgi:hypothetical protein